MWILFLGEQREKFFDSIRTKRVIVHPLYSGDQRFIPAWGLIILKSVELIITNNKILHAHTVCYGMASRDLTNYYTHLPFFLAKISAKNPLQLYFQNWNLGSPRIRIKTSLVSAAVSAPLHSSTLVWLLPFDLLQWKHDCFTRSDTTLGLNNLVWNDFWIVVFGMGIGQRYINGTCLLQVSNFIFTDRSKKNFSSANACQEKSEMINFKKPPHWLSFVFKQDGKVTEVECWSLRR